MGKTIDKIILLTALCCIIFTGCHKKDNPPEDNPPPSYDVDLQTVWRRYFFSVMVGDETFIDPIFWNDYLIVSNLYGSVGVRGIRVLNKYSGGNHPAWSERPVEIVDNEDYIRNTHIGGSNGNTLFTGFGSKIYAINLNTGQPLWKTTESNYHAGEISMLGNMPFQPYWQRVGSNSQYCCYIAKYDPDTGEKTNIYEVCAGENNELRLFGPAWTLNESGDTLLLFLSEVNEINAYCYNVTRNEMVWEKKDFTKDARGDLFTTLILNNNKVLFQTMKKVHCFDISTGEILWQYMPVLWDRIESTPPLYRDEKIYIRTNGGLVTCLDAQTGQIIWKNTEQKYSPVSKGSMDVYNGKLYLTAYNGWYDFYLLCLSAQTGELLWRSKGPFGSIKGGVIIDQNTGYLYCVSTFSEILCVDLNKTPKTSYP